MARRFVSAKREGGGRTAALLCCASALCTLVWYGGEWPAERSRGDVVNVVQVPQPAADVRTMPRQAEPSAATGLAAAGQKLKSGVGGRDAAADMLRMLQSDANGEARDQVWADRSEFLLKSSLARLTPYGAEPAVIGCRQTLCKVSGLLPPAFDTDRVATMLQVLQGAEVRNVLPDASLIGGPAVTSRTDIGTRYAIFFRKNELPPA